MKYDELIAKIIQDIKDGMEKNKELYQKEEVDIKDFNLFLMYRECPVSIQYDIQSTDTFEKIAKTVYEMTQELKKHKLAKYEETKFENDNGKWGGILYGLSIYTPRESFDDMEEWYREYVIREHIAKELGLLHPKNIMCHMLSLYKEDVITLEILKKSHKASC